MDQITLLPFSEPLLAPVTYQGGKGRLADEIVERMGISAGARFYDLCCGSGAVSLAAVNAGVSPSRIVMVDSGPWGLVWQAIGSGAFDLERFEFLCGLVPTDPRSIKGFVEKLYREPSARDDVAYVYLVLQAAAIGGKSISLEGDRWVRGSGFRDYWLPTATSSRRSHVNPMMPMPATMVKRVRCIVKQMRGVTGIHGDAAAIAPDEGSVIYIDPPYAGTTSYGYAIDVLSVAKRMAERGAVWVSEGRALTEDAVCLSRGRAKGGITGDRKVAAHEEWLSLFVSKPV